VILGIAMQLMIRRREIHNNSTREKYRQENNEPSKIFQIKVEKNFALITELIGSDVTVLEDSVAYRKAQ